MNGEKVLNATIKRRRRPLNALTEKSTYTANNSKKWQVSTVADGSVRRAVVNFCSTVTLTGSTYGEQTWQHTARFDRVIENFSISIVWDDSFFGGKGTQISLCKYTLNMVRITDIADASGMTTASDWTLSNEDEFTFFGQKHTSTGIDVTFL